MQLIFLYVLLTTCQLTTIAAPALQRHLSEGGTSGGRSVLVADTDTEAGGADLGVTGVENGCSSNTPRVIERCLNGFEVQFISYNQSRTAESRRFAMRDLCRQHDHTLHCIYRAFILCPATSVDLQIVASRIGHHRDFMLHQCIIVRKSTIPPPTTTSVVTTTVLPPSTTILTHPSVATPSQPTFLRTDSTSNPRDGKKIIKESNWGSIYVSLSTKTTPTSQVKQFEDEYVIESNADLKHRKYPSSTRDDTWCQGHEGQNSLECYFQALRGSAIVIRARPLLPVLCLTLVLLTLW